MGVGAGAPTWMVALADTLGCVGSATVIVASPAPTALTSPVALTVATASSEEDQTTPVTFASVGSWVALSVRVSPTPSVADSRDNASDVMGIGLRATGAVAPLTGQSHTCR